MSKEHMTRNSGTRFGIILAGLAGFAVILRAAMYYQSVDGLAFSLTLVMAAALAVGLGELLWRDVRAARLRQQLDKLPASPSSLDEIGGEIRPILRAHLESDPMPPASAILTPYLIGLLVMLGLLGTFLGLFETLRGARAALASGADVNALRAGLSQPMGGLMRSFGTSAAGVASSAMLGLAAVFARRSARSFQSAVHSICAGALSHLSASRRQLSALEALADQGQSLPLASEALERAVAALERLEQRQQASHAESLRAQEDMTRQFAARIDGLGSRWEAAHAGVIDSISRVAQSLEQSDQRHQRRQEETAKAMRVASEKVATTVHDRLDAVGASLAKLGDRWDESHQAATKAQAHTAETLTKRFSEELSTSRQSLDALALAWREAQVEAIEEQSKAYREATADVARAAAEAVSGAASSSLQTAVEQSVELVHRFEQKAAERAQTEQQARQSLDAKLFSELQRQGASLIKMLDDAAAAAADRDEQRAELLHARALELDERLDQASQEAAKRDQSRAASLEGYAKQLGEALQGAASAAASRDEERASRIHAQADALLTSMSEAAVASSERDQQRAQVLGSVADRVREQLDASSQAEAERSERAAAFYDRFEEASRSVTEAVGRQVEVLASQEAKLQDRFDALVDRMTTVVDAQAARLAELEKSISDSHQTHTQALSQHLQGELGSTAELVREAAALVKGGGAELTAAVEMFSTVVSQHGEAAQRWLEGLGAVERAVEEAGGEAAVDVLGQYLTRTHELFDQQLGFQQELVQQLRVAKETSGVSA